MNFLYLYYEQQKVLYLFDELLEIFCLFHYTDRKYLDSYLVNHHLLIYIQNQKSSVK